jgi:hypothetical protein
MLETNFIISKRGKIMWKSKLCCILICVLLVVIVSCGGGSEGKDDNENPDLSKIGASWTEDRSTAIIADTDGNVMAAQEDSVVLITSDDERFVVYYGENNLPTRAVIENYIIIYDNWTASTVDIAVISPEGIYTIYRGLEVESDLLATAFAPSVSKALAKIIHLGSVTYAFEIYDLAATLQIGGKVMSAAFCFGTVGSAIFSGGVTAVAIGTACASTVLTVASKLTKGDNALVETTGDSLLVISSIICDNPLSCAGAWTDLAGRVLEYGRDIQDNQSALVAEAETKLSDNYDMTAPMIPTGLVVDSIFSNEISLSWDPSYDNVGVTKYRVYRDGDYLLTVLGTSVTDTGLNPDTQYCYAVSAVDMASNVSSQSSEVCTKTDSDCGAVEVCGNCIDDDCDGVPDDGCLPNVPTDLVVVPISPNGLSVEWQDGSCNEDGFELRICMPTSNNVSDYTHTLVKTSVNISLSLSGRWWEIWVRAFNTNGYSDWIYTSGVSPSD